jgi:para-aminobenzoate synthetase/4-amino-4-deoxychorismate lyase
MFVYFEKEQQAWRVFEDLRAVECAQSYDQVLPALRRVEQAVESKNFCAFGFVSYEAAPAFDFALPTQLGRMPLLWFGIFARSTLTTELPAGFVCSADRVQRLEWQASVTQAEYKAKLENIRSFIRRGDSYQINYSLRLRSVWNEPLTPLWGALLTQPVAPYAGYLELEDYSIGSLSPELFFELQGDQLHIAPMKGTRARGRTAAQDYIQAQELRSSPKEQSENLMIVDLMRSDLGRVAMPASVKVEHSLEVEKFATTLQMVSRVSARSSATLLDIFAALFPSGSVTGAPKCRSMQIISQVEDSPRGIYTGAIGYILPQRKAKFSVAIRTLVHDKKAQQLEYGTGGGILFEADAAAEYEECLTKARALRHVEKPVSLLETMRWDPGQGYYLLVLHMQRLCESASYFSIALDERAVVQKLERYAEQFPDTSQRVRLVVSPKGEARIEHSKLLPNSEPVRIAIAKQAIDSTLVSLYHKTTNRSLYEQALHSCPEAEQVILWNERGELTEACTANLVLKIGERFFTPPISSGLLAGTMRQSLLQMGELNERLLYPEDLKHCSEIFLINSVRGWQRAALI